MRNESRRPSAEMVQYLKDKLTPCIGQRVTVQFVWHGRSFLETGMLLRVGNDRIELEHGKIPVWSESAAIRSVHTNLGEMLINAGVKPTHGAEAFAELFNSSNDPRLESNAVVTADIEHEAHTYLVNLNIDEDGRYTARVPKLKGCLSDGSTKREALVNIKETMALFLENMKRNGESIPVEDLSKLQKLLRENP